MGIISKECREAHKLMMAERTAKAINPLRLQERIFEKIVVVESCWEWIDFRDKWGYGHLYVGGEIGRVVMAHIVSYQTIRGAIPEGLELDHLCRNTGCVNPWHLEVVTHKVNMERGKQATKTHCKHGHEFTKENIYYLKTGNRQCRICRSNRIRAWWKENGWRHRAGGVSPT